LQRCTVQAFASEHITAAYSKVVLGIKATNATETHVQNGAQ
jgi:hypothetical protein